MGKTLKQTPPKTARRILGLFRNSIEHESLIGDFDELYRFNAERYGSFYARRWYWRQVLKAAPSFVMNSLIWRVIMLRNYVKIALRNFVKHKGYSFINIAGFAAGIACAILILIYVQFEFSYDKFHEDSDRIFRACLDFRAKGQPDKYAAITPPNLAPSVREYFPEAEYAIRLLPEEYLIRYGDKQYFEDRIFYAEQPFFNVFSFPLVHGNPETALRDPFTAVLTRETARKYFGDENPMGRVITIDNKTDYTVTGVMENVPSNSHIKFDILFSFSTLKEKYPGEGRSPINNWFNHGFYTYIKTTSDTPSPEFMEGVFNLSATLIGDIEEASGFQQKFFLMPLTDIHLKSDLEFEAAETGSETYLYMFIVIAAFVLIIASINFMNLATARSAGRAREIGMRKVIGAARRQLVAQFLGEALIITFISLGIALLIVGLALPAFNDFTGKNLALRFNDAGTIIAGLSGFLLIGLFSGSYPAFFLSAFRCVDTLKGTVKGAVRGAVLRKCLVIVQFSISIALIAGSLIVLRQIQFMKTKDLGFDKEHVVVLSLRGSAETGKKYELLEQEFIKHNAVMSASASYSVPGRTPSSRAMLPEGFSNDEWQAFFINWADYDYLETFDIELVAGRFFSREFETDKMGAFILNESAVQYLGWGTPEDAIGKKWYMGPEEKGEVIGVTSDYHYSSLHQKITPFVMHFNPRRFNYLSLRITGEDIPETLKFIEGKWKEHLPGAPYDYFFLDQDFDRQYRAEEKANTIFAMFTAVAVVIACLGLLGLAAFMVEKRTKEIGIRKALGAPSAGIIVLLSKEFLKWVLAANVIAWPAAWFVMNKWLESFAYRIDIGLLVFLFSGGLALVIALFTVGYQTLRAARANPVDSLRYE